MVKPLSIPKILPFESTLNYEFLRAEGIKHIQRLAGHIWTDHNAHDPGITILEQLCYAITDLGFRIDNKIEALLGSDEGSTYQDLYSPATIFTVNPVTLLDLRKIVIDIPGVKNAWVEQSKEANNGGGQSPPLRGLYKVLYERSESADVNPGLLGRVRARLNACRGICEDFAEIRQLDSQLIRLQGSIEVGQVEDINQLVAEVLYLAATHISPQIPFYTLQEMLDKGKKIETIFDGPTLEHGFIEDEDLLNTPRKKEIYASDLIKEIMDNKEVRAIRDLALSTGSTRKSWVLPLDMSKTPILDLVGSLDSLQFVRQGLNATINKERVRQLFLQRRDLQQFPSLDLPKRDVVLPETADRNLGAYYSLQNQFPANYGIGELGLAPSATSLRKAQAKQLKGYLVFFEQLLANYFSQIAHVKDLFSFDGEDRRTYFNQSLLGSTPGLEEILVTQEGYEAYLEGSSQDTNESLERKNKFLNHLLARFSEIFTDYGLLLHNPETKKEFASEKKLIQDKSYFLKEYPVLSSERAKAYDFKQDSWQSANVSGLEKRIARKIGVEDYTRRNLADSNTEGFHLVEHLLLRHPADSWQGEIGRFQAGDTREQTRCISPGHGLEPGDPILIQESSGYDGDYTVEQSTQNDFVIDIPFDRELNQGGTPVWQSTTPDIRDLVFSSKIHSFAAASQSGYTRCEAPDHRLVEGQTIEILGTEAYDGAFVVQSVSAHAFEIEQLFAQNETLGRWKPIGMASDFYSLQLTYVFPNWTDRYQVNDFKGFVGNTIREETPAHITAYIQWLSRDEMKRFDRSFRHFLNQQKDR